MLKFSKRFKSSLVKAEATNALNKVIEEVKPYYEMDEFQTDHMKKFFQKDSLIIPADVIVEKYKAEDYDFFLDKSNFMKVTDTLEKFTASLDMEHEEARDFVLFKKKLYRLYEVRSRSTAEHAIFSTQITEDELTHVYKAHDHYLKTIATDNYIKRHRAQQRLQGGYYKKKLMSPGRLRGLTSTAVALAMYIYNPYMMAYVKWNYILAKGFQAAPIAAALYGLYNLSESNMVSSISRIDEGGDAGKVKVSVYVSPIVTKEVIADPKDIVDGGRIARLDMSALRIKKGYDVQTGKEFTEERVYTMETEGSDNAWVDVEGMDWLLDKKLESSETDELYAELIHDRCKQIANTKREQKDLLNEVRYAIEQ